MKQTTALEKAATVITHVAQLMMTGRLNLPTDLIEELGDALEAINKEQSYDNRRPRPRA